MTWLASRVEPGQAHNCTYIVITSEGTTTTVGNPDCADDEFHTCTSTLLGTVNEIVCAHNPP